MPFLTKDHQWNTVDVQGIDGFLHHGRVIDCADEGLKIDFGCKGELGPLSIPFGRIYPCKLQCFSDKGALENGRELAVEVLLRLTAEEPAKWYPSTLLTGDFSSSSSFGLIRAVTPGRIVTEIVPGECVREQRNGIPEGLGKDDFAKGVIVLPGGICSGVSSPGVDETAVADQHLVDGFNSHGLGCGMMATHFDGSVLHVLKISDEYRGKLDLDHGEKSTELEKRTLQRMLESISAAQSAAANKVQYKPTVTQFTLPPPPHTPSIPYFAPFQPSNIVPPLRIWSGVPVPYGHTPMSPSPRMFVPTYLCCFRARVPYYPVSRVFVPMPFPMIIPPPGTAVICRVFAPGICVRPVYRHVPYFINGTPYQDRPPQYQIRVPHPAYPIRQLEAVASVDDDMHILALPIDTLVDIFQCLDTVSQASVLPVCTTWYFTASSSAVNRVLLLPRERSDRVVRVSLLKSWMPETKIIVYAGVESVGGAAEPCRGLLCGGKLFRCILQERRFYRLDMVVLADLSWSRQTDWQKSNICTGYRSGKGHFHKFVRYICEELNAFVAVFKNVVLHDISVTLAKSEDVVMMAVHIHRGHIVGRLTIENLWEKMEENVPGLDYAGTVRVSMLVRDELCHKRVIEILDDVQSADPRLHNQFRGKQWTPADLAVVDLCKLSRLTRHRLLKECSSGQLTISLCL